MGTAQVLQKDLADIFDTPSIVSEVMNGKREVNRDHIRLRGFRPNFFSDASYPNKSDVE